MAAFSCRLCGELEDSVSLLYDLSDISSQLIECFQWERQEQAVEANLPQNVCILCYLRLQLSGQFFQTIRKTEEALLKLFIQSTAVPIPDGGISYRQGRVVISEMIPDNPEEMPIKSGSTSLHAPAPTLHEGNDEGELIDIPKEVQHSDIDGYQHEVECSDMNPLLKLKWKNR